MALDKMNQMWKMMLKNRFEIEDATVTDVFCTICEKLMINAHSGPCGCRYCLDCIKKYLNGGQSVCPGNTDDCGEEITTEQNLYIDQAMNIKISRLRVKCSTTGCDFKEELRNMERHIKICGQLNFIGELDKESVENVRNDVCSLKKDVNVFIHTSLESQKNMANRQTRYEKLIDELQRLYEVEGQKVKILEEKIEKIEKDFDQKSKTMSEEIERISARNVDLEMILDKNIQSSLNLKNKIKELDIKLKQHIGGEFDWCIKRWRSAMEVARLGIFRSLYSEAFYSHRKGYKMCLNVFPNGNGTGAGTHLGVYFCLMKGPYDEKLPWPFKHDVTFHLVNQQTDGIHCSKLIKYNDSPDLIVSYGKPTTEKNLSYGSPQFISFEELSNNKSLCHNDEILLRCKIHTNESYPASSF